MGHFKLFYTFLGATLQPYSISSGTQLDVLKSENIPRDFSNAQAIGTPRYGVKEAQF